MSQAPTSASDTKGALSERDAHPPTDAETGGADESATAVSGTAKSGETTPRRGVDTIAWLSLLIAAASLMAVLWNLQDASVENANTGSRYATVESLVDHGTWVINDSIYAHTIDRVKIGHDYYSSKPPLLPAYTAATYWVYQQVTGYRFITDEGNVVRFCSLMTGWLFHLVFLFYLYRVARLLLTSQRAVLGLMLLGAFAFLGAGYATTLNNHSIAATFAWIGFYYALRARGEPERAKPWCLSGLALGILPALDVPSAFISAAIGVYLLKLDFRKTLIWFAPAALPGLAAHFILTYVSTGSVIPVYMRRDLYDYAGSYWNNERGIDALREPKHIYGFHVLFGHHGLFSMTPVLAFGAWELYRTIRSKLDWRPEAILATVIALGMTIFYIFYSHNYGGWCVGMRWLVPSMPFLFLFAALWLERVRLVRWQALLFAGAFAVSTFHVQDAMDGPFQYSVWHNWMDGKPNRGRTGKTFNLKDHRPKPKKLNAPKKRSRRDRAPRQR